jgi:hypothetical protein
MKFQVNKLLFVLLISIVFILKIDAQTGSIGETDKGNLYLGIRNINFLKDNEYYSPVIEGYTLVGYFFQPTLVYLPSEKVTLKAGIHLLDYAGTKGFTIAKPVFSTTYNFSERTSITIGTLNGSDKHQMFDPHFDLERTYSAYSEDGFEFLTMNDHLFNDTWISWENFIFKGDTTREIFTFGQSFRYKSGKIADSFNFEFPVQLQAKHQGGQISNYPQEIETYFNFAAGPVLFYDISEKRFGTLGIDYLRFIYRQVPPEQMAINSGYSDWYRFHYNYKAFYLMIGYWKSHDFFAPNGNTIYSSFSDYQENVVIPDRKILTCSAYLTAKPAENLELFLGLDVYYDLIRKRSDLAFALHLSFDKLIHLEKVN